MAATGKITPRVAPQVAWRLRLAASMRSLSMSRVVNDALDEVLPSLEEIRTQLAVPVSGDAEAGMAADITARHAGPATVTTSGGAAAPALDGGAGDGGIR